MKTTNLSLSADAPLSARRLATALFVSLLLLSALPALAADRTVRNEGATAAKSLARIARLPATRQLQVAIGLPLRNMPALTNALHDLYTTGSTNFHHFLTPEQFTEQFGPSAADYQAVIQFAKNNGLQVVKTSGNRALLEVSGTVANFEQAFHVTLGTYRHPTEDREFYAPDVEPSVDASVPVHYIQGLDNFTLMRPVSHFHKNVQAGSPRNNGVSQPNDDNGTGQGGLYLGSDFRNAYAPGVSLNGSGQIVG